MNINSILNKIDKKEEQFYQSKFEYYKNMTYYLILTSCIASIFYWITDCMLYNRIAYETLTARISIVLFLYLFVYVYKNTDSYKICIPIAYFTAHSIIFCTEWAVYGLQNRSHAGEGLMVIECIFIFLSFCAPKKYSLIYHMMVIPDIIVANIFIHFEDFFTIIVMHCILIAGTEFMTAYIENAYKDKYANENKITHLMKHDQLTDAYNRSILKDLCYKDTNIINMKNPGILILDIDFFKKINDTYGHNIGDKILIRITKEINSVIRKEDFLIRWGGEEFVVIMNDANYRNLEAIARRINQQIKKNIKDYNVTVSIGGVIYDDQDYKDNIKRADEALYYVKTHGRNSVMIA